jgi:hypothetical protein
MTPDERERMQLLCEQIAKEEDPEEFTKLVQELNDLLEHKVQRLERPARPLDSKSSICPNDPNDRMVFPGVGISFRALPSPRSTHPGCPYRGAGAGNRRGRETGIRRSGQSWRDSSDPRLVPSCGL